ncbi:uncharacterized protein L969DRAFT_91596 [Mixia osmundae IAM 14324]|uniref:Uncharacterized protein n=1 Tax=Mixia osmundae (strain CBS 9802 / IAM 14324 / JCM 22182 / KY 12970) TaxID=764103 RepID=G7DZY2_MIXOS|nr:uncharacterized protein L969DRAFT_91596 [Mixia osmundae IAM 14324]KEI42133.1 hypothetical protein L969DRAFT_91596 [Mixia osmundae IAM 14324]GAA96142.1 hypothetical protein E5Q_02803 [Mixia osmundae IAM 14324]
MASEISITIRAPGDTKLPITIDAGATVLQLKQKIADELVKIDASKPCPPEQQRLIYSGKIMKDEESIQTYKVASGNTVHLVKSQPKAAPPPAAAQVPEMQAGQQVAGNPLAPLMNATHPGLGGFNPFSSMGINQNDPNMLQNMMQSPEMQNQLNAMLSRPEVVDQLIESSPELRQLGPQARQIMQSPMFRQMMTSPDAIRASMEMMRNGGPSAAGPGMFGGAAAPNTGAPPAAGSTGLAAPPSAQQLQDMMRMMAGGAGAEGGAAAGAANPFAALGANPFAGMGAFGSGAPAAPTDTRPPEERFEGQLRQLSEMGFHDAQRNIRALMATGGNVQAAIEYLFSAL